MSANPDLNAARKSGIAVAAAFASLLLVAFWAGTGKPSEETGPPPRPQASRIEQPTPDTTRRVREEPVPSPTMPVLAAASREPALEDMIASVLPAVVTVVTTDGRGTGFFVARDTILTNAHVIAGHRTVTIQHADNARQTALVDAASQSSDLALLKVGSVRESQPIIRLGLAATVRPGQDVVAVGSALGTLQNTVTRGIVSALRREGTTTMIQVDAAINPGNSGGPILARDGRAIGIATMSYSTRQGLNFAVAADHARALLEGGTTSTERPAHESPLAPTGRTTVTDDRRDTGEREHERALTAAGRRADVMDRAWQEFVTSCYQGPVLTLFDRDWYALFEEEALPGVVRTACNGRFSELVREAHAIRDAVLAADEAARRAGVYPGSRRSARRSHRLDYTGWDR
jgi:S1-C subfamily serine protease